MTAFAAIQTNSIHARLRTFAFNQDYCRPFVIAGKRKRRHHERAVTLNLFTSSTASASRQAGKPDKHSVRLESLTYVRLAASKCAKSLRELKRRIKDNAPINSSRCQLPQTRIVKEPRRIPKSSPSQKPCADPAMRRRLMDGGQTQRVGRAPRQRIAASTKSHGELRLNLALGHSPDCFRHHIKRQTRYPLRCGEGSKYTSGLDACQRGSKTFFTIFEAFSHGRLLITDR
jgi:hypothetical protein